MGLAYAGGNVGDTGRLQVEVPVDLFGRVSVAQPATLFDCKHDVSARTDLWTSSGTITNNIAYAEVILSVAGSSVTTTFRQSKRRIIYQPGKAQVGLFTFVMGTAATGITRRVGLFNADNGLFLEQTSAGAFFCVRKATLDTRIPQASWNIDPLDGTGPSGVTLDLSKSQILFIAYEWLGVGAISYGFVVNGQIIECHRQQHSNLIVGVYMNTPNLPVRYEIKNDGTGNAATFTQICSSVAANGGVQILGRLISFDRGSTALTTLNDSNLYPLLAMRLSSIRANAIIDASSVLCTSTTILWRWALLLNPTVVGTALSWSSNSDAVEVARPTNATTVTGGTLIQSGYAINASAIRSVTTSGLDDNFLGFDSAGNADVLVLAAQRLTGTTETFYASLGYREQL